MHPVFMSDYAEVAVIFFKPATHDPSLLTMSVIILTLFVGRHYGSCVVGFTGISEQMQNLGDFCCSPGSDIAYALLQLTHVTYRPKTRRISEIL